MSVHVVAITGLTGGLKKKCGRQPSSHSFFRDATRNTSELGRDSTATLTTMSAGEADEMADVMKTADNVARATTEKQAGGHRTMRMMLGWDAVHTMRTSETKQNSHPFHGPQQLTDSI